MAEGEKDLFADLKPTQDPAYPAFLEQLKGPDGQTLDTIGPVEIQLLLASLREQNMEASMPRLIQIMSAHGYSFNPTDPDHPTFTKVA